ncbi:MAG: TIGR04282 family arsenosugar biosynthesis glycosyltransferase [Actinomycetota bacterium]
MRSEVTLVVLAKQPVAGFSKTRLSPPFSFEEAAELARAMLDDTLKAVAATPGVRPLLALKGEPGPWVPDGFEVIAQRGASHAQRIDAAFEDAGGPALLIGMDTPQVTPELLARSVEALQSKGVDSVLGPARDGGWWAAGFCRPVSGAFVQVPMSRSDTFRHQVRRFEQLGLQWAQLPTLSDVDDIDSARAVAAAAPESSFAALLAAGMLCP